MPVRMMVWAGLLCGLLANQAVRLWQAPYKAAAIEATHQAEDLYAEARRSQAILEAQEGAPPPIATPAPSAEARPSYAIPEGVESPLPPAAMARRGEPAQFTAAVRVIDGDTFVYGGTRIRIADIDAPEVHGRCAYETALAARATARMGALLAAGPFALQPSPDGRDEDRYGRKLRIVSRGGRSLGGVLVAEGLARGWTGHREPWCG